MTNEPAFAGVATARYRDRFAPGEVDSRQYGSSIVSDFWIIFMSRLLLPSIVLLSHLLPVAAGDDETVTIQRPFLWEFWRADSEATSYLFGTIHVNDPNITRLHPKVNAAFESSTAAWFEIDFAEDRAAQTEAISLPQDERLEDHVSADTLARIDRRLMKLSPLLSRTALPEFRVVMWPIVLANLKAQVRHLGTLPMDMQLQMAARAANMKTGGLEDAENQLRKLTDLPMEKQIAFLEAFLDVMDSDDAAGLNQMEILIKLYAAGDGDDLQKHLERELQRPQVSDDLQKLFVDVLLIERNDNMVKAIELKISAAPDDVHFVAVGTAHLLGKQSVIEGLRESGFTVRRVTIDNESSADSDQK